jgi:folate-binding protein YgfZ
MRTLPADEQVRAIDAGRAFVELAGVTLTLVSGSEARAWLNDLVTTDVATLQPSSTRPSLLLSPTGRIRAQLHVLCLSDRDFVLAQPSDQPEPVGGLLAPYVLSSDVSVSGSRLRLFALPGLEEVPAGLGEPHRPSVLGGGFDLLVGAGDEAIFDDVRVRLASHGLEPASADAAEARRVAGGTARFPTDLGPDSLPAEAGLDGPPTTDRTKGCFLGQEAVARVANLGHPTRRIVPVVADGPISVGEAVLADGSQTGVVTSANGSLALVRVRWNATRERLTTASGSSLRPR